MANGLFSFLEGFVGQANTNIATQKKAEADKLARREELADNLGVYMQQSDYKQKIDRSNTEFANELDLTKMSKANDYSKDQAQFSSGLALNNALTVEGVKSSNDLKKAEREAEIGNTQLKSLMDGFGLGSTPSITKTISGGPTVENAAKLKEAQTASTSSSVQKLTNAKAAAEMLQGTNKHAKGFADSLDTQIKAIEKQGESAGKPTEFAGGDPYKAADDMIKANKIASPLFPNTDKVKPNDTRAIQANSDVNDIIKGLGSITRMTNEATGTPTANSELSGPRIAGIAIEMTRAKNTLMSDKSSDLEKLEAAKIFNSNLKQAKGSLDYSAISSLPEFRNVITPEFTAKYNSVVEANRKPAATVQRNDSSSSYPKTVTNSSGARATVSNSQEEAEANSEGFR